MDFIYLLLLYFYVFEIQNSDREIYGRKDVGREEVTERERERKWRSIGSLP